MGKIDTRIDIRISSEDKQILLDYCKENNIKISTLLRKCALNYVRDKKRENENK